MVDEETNLLFPLHVPGNWEGMEEHPSRDFMELERLGELRSPRKRF
jgi:hypothetical protein